MSMIETDEVLFLKVSGLCGIEDKGLFLSSLTFLFLSLTFCAGLFPLKVGVDFWTIKPLWLVVVFLFGAFLLLSFVVLVFFETTKLDWLVTNCFLDPGWFVVLVVVVFSSLVFDLRPELSGPPLFVVVVVLVVVTWVLPPLLGWLGWVLKLVWFVVVVLVVVTCSLDLRPDWFGWFLSFVVVVFVVVINSFFVLLLWFSWSGLFFWFVVVVVVVVISSLNIPLRPEAPSFLLLLSGLNPSFVDVVFVVVVVLKISFFPLRISFLSSPPFWLVVVVVLVSVVLVNLDTFSLFWLSESFLFSFKPDPSDSLVTSISVVVIIFFEFL